MASGVVYLSKILEGKTGKICITDGGCPDIKVLHNTRLFTIYDFDDVNYYLMTINSKRLLDLKTQKHTQEDADIINDDDDYETSVSDYFKNYDFIKSQKVEHYDIHESVIYIEKLGITLPVIVSRSLESYRADGILIAITPELTTLNESIFNNPEDINNEKLLEKMIAPLKSTISKLNSLNKEGRRIGNCNHGLIFKRIIGMKFRIDLFICDYSYDDYPPRVRRWGAIDINRMLRLIAKLESRYNPDIEDIIASRIEKSQKDKPILVD